MDEVLVGYSPPEDGETLRAAIVAHELPFRVYASKRHRGLLGIACSAPEAERQSATLALWDAIGEKHAPGALAAWKAAHGKPAPPKGRGKGKAPRRRRAQ